MNSPALDDRFFLDKNEQFFVATKCCVFYEEKILILAELFPDDTFWWELPGGKIQKDERNTPICESLARELREEIGDDFGVEEGGATLFVAQKSFEQMVTGEDIPPTMFLCYFLKLHAEPSISLSREHGKYRWITEDEIDSIEWWRDGFDTIVRQAFLYKKIHTHHTPNS